MVCHNVRQAYLLMVDLMHEANTSEVALGLAKSQIPNSYAAVHALC